MIKNLARVRNCRMIYVVVRKQKNFTPVCYHCGLTGHIRPSCPSLSKSSTVDNSALFSSFQKQLNDQMTLIKNFTDKLSTSKVSTSSYQETNDLICLMAYANLVDDEPTIVVCLVTLTALADKESDSWYMDSGCSKHMTGNKDWFISFDDTFTSGKATFGDGRRAKVIG